MAKALTVPSIEPFKMDGDCSGLSSKWERWLKSFQYFVAGSGVTDKTQKRALLLHLVGCEVQQIFETFEDTGSNADYEKAVQKLNDYFKPQKNISFERHKFNSETRNPNESIQDYVTRLKHLALSCEFTDKNDRIRDQIVEKCYSTHLRTKLLCEKDLTLEKALEVASTYERATDSAKKIENGNRTQTTEENFNGNVYQVKRNGRRNAKQPAKSNPQAECYRCGSSSHVGTSAECPAKTVECNKCHFTGHYARKCKSTRIATKQRVRTVNSAETGSSDDEECTFMLKDKFANSRLDIIVGNVVIKGMIIDSGASCNVIDKNTWEFLKSQSRFNWLSAERTTKKIFAYGSKTPLKLAGTFRANVEGNGIAIRNVQFVVLDGEGQSILGKDLATELNVLRVGPQQVCTINNDIEQKYPKLFSGIGKLKNFQLKVPIDDSVQPVVQAVRRVPYHLREMLNSKIESLLQQDIIEKVDTPSPWVSPIVVVPKGNEDIRLCVDMRQANRAVKRVRHAMPVIEDILQEMNGSNVFSKLDIKNAYHQIELDPDSRDITTFVTPSGQYRYKRLVFGISCASEMYQNLLQQILQGCANTQNIMDDIIVHGVTQEEHDRCLDIVLKVLSEKGFTLNREKCQFNMSELVFMGNVVSKHGVGPTQSKVQDVLDARRPGNASEVRSFLGLVNFNARYIRDLATISEPLRNLTRKNANFHWGKKEQTAFGELKKRLASAEILGFYDKNAKTQVICDASPVGLGAVLLQKQGGEHRVICYASKSLSKAEQKLSQLEREALAIVWGIERFHVYLYGTEFELLTDCKPLQFIFSPKSKPSARIERWVLRLQAYKFTTRHIKGQDNISDCLSRLLNESRRNDESTHAFVLSDQYVKFVAVNATPCAVTTRDIEKASRYDDEIASLRVCIANNSWHKLQYTEYLPIRHELSSIGFLVLRGTRILVPRELRERILEIAHESHPGIVVMKQNLRQNVYWPNIDKDVEKHCKTCYGCQLVSSPEKPEAMTRTELPNAPWEHLAIDWLGPLNSKDYILVAVDYYSRYVELGYSKSPTSESAIRILRSILSRHGNPLSIQTDNASCFTSEIFGAFLSENGISHRHTTPLWPSANGEVERQNRSIMKRIKIAQAENRNWKLELDNYLLTYRSSPHSTTGVSPAELLFGRKIRSKLPNVQNYRVDTEVRDRDAENKQKGKMYSDRKRNAGETLIKPGDQVLLKQHKHNKLDTNFESEPYVVLEKFGNSVVIERNGVKYKRNVTAVKRFLDKDGFSPENDRTPGLSATRTIDNELPIHRRVIRRPRKYSDFV